jgi:hypothetical protein
MTVYNLGFMKYIYTDAIYLFVVGMVSTFFYALLTNRGYLMNWQKGDPTTLEDVFEKPTINWSFNPREMKKLYSTGKKGSKGRNFKFVNTLNFKWENIRETMFPDGPSQDFNELWKAKVKLSKKEIGVLIYNIFFFLCKAVCTS